MIRRTVRALGVIALVLALAACAGLPTSGPVNAGRGAVEEERDNDISYLPDRPVEDASPGQIVEGFLAAGSGPRGNWSVAREFLTDRFRGDWDPRAGVLVHTTDAGAPVEAGAGTVVLTVEPVATVDRAGTYSTATGGEVPLEFRLEQDADDQWRIAEAPDGIVIDQRQFATVFGGYSIMYFDPTWTYLVPDERWFPQLEFATSIAETLVSGEPSPWLAESVVSAFTDRSHRSQGAVPVRQGVAQVFLDSSARALDQTVLDRMQTQLDYSFLAAGISTVEMMIDDQVLTARAIPVRSTRIDPRPLVLTTDGFGFLSGDSLAALPGFSAAITSLPDPPVWIEMDADREAAAVQAADGRIARVDSDGEVMALTGAGAWLAPSVDAAGFIWTAGEQTPSSVTVFGPDGEQYALADMLSGVTRIDALGVSRDGSRLTIAGHEGSVSTVWVAGIVRDDDGVPVALGDRKTLTILDGSARQATWLDAATVAVLTVTGGGEWTISEQRVGGAPTVVRAPAGTVAISSSTQAGGIRALDASGVLHLQRGGTWQRVAADVAVLATQQGQPQ